MSKAYEAKSQAPLLINSCQIDSQFPITAQEIADKLLTGFGPGYKRTYSAGCTHGFAVRGDLVRNLLLFRGPRDTDDILTMTE